MKLYFYRYSNSRQTIIECAAEVKETEKTYKAMPDARTFPFMYKRKMLKTDLNKCENFISDMICVLDHADTNAARKIFLEYATRRMNAAQDEMSRWAGRARGIENAGVIT